MGNKPLVGIQVAGFPKKEAAKLTRELGVEITIAPLWWGEVEPSVGKRDFGRMKDWDKLESELGFLPERVWTLYPIHMNNRGQLPEQLITAPFDSTEMEQGFNGFIGEAAEACGWKQGAPIVLIGNEVDIFADSQPQELEPALGFLEKATEIVKHHAPRARVCHAVTFDTLHKPTGPALIDRLNEKADIYCFTYYGLGADMGVGGTRPLEGVIEEMIEAAAGKPVLIVEIGLPSSPLLESSEEHQARRVEEIFDLGSRFDRSQLIGTIWLTANDWPVDPIREYVEQQFAAFAGNERFLAFLTSNGIRDHRGQPKEAYRVWKKRVEEKRTGL